MMVGNEWEIKTVITETKPSTYQSELKRDTLTNLTVIQSQYKKKGSCLSRVFMCQ